MDRIIGANTIDLGGGRRGFRGKDTVGGIPGTEVRATWLNSVQEEVVGLIEACGGDPSNADLTQLLKAIRSGALNFIAVGGTADALTIDLDPQLDAYTPGMPLRLMTGPAANNGPMTIAVDALPTKALVRRGGEPLAPGDVPAASLLTVTYDGASWRIESLVRSDLIDLDFGKRLPIHAEVQTSDGRLTVTAGVASVVVTGASLTWRGWKDFDLTALSAPNRTFATAASKTYHLRWDASGTGLATPAATYPNGRLSLRDLADAAYNPSALGEESVAFDTTYDSVLIARVVTDGANVATINALANRPRLSADYTVSGPGYIWNSGGSNDGAGYQANFSYMWGRTPITMIVSGFAATAGTGYVNGGCNLISRPYQNRYGSGGLVTTDYVSDLAGNTIAGGLTFQGIA